MLLLFAFSYYLTNFLIAHSMKTCLHTSHFCWTFFVCILRAFMLHNSRILFCLQWMFNFRSVSLRWCLPFKTWPVVIASSLVKNNGFGELQDPIRGKHSDPPAQRPSCLLFSICWMSKDSAYPWSNCLEW